MDFPRNEQFSIVDPVKRTTDKSCNIFLRKQGTPMCGLIIFLIFGVAIGSTVGTYYYYTSPTKEENFSEHTQSMDIRLPNNVKPIYYKLNVMPFIEKEKNFTLWGEVWIDVECIEDTSYITLHIKDIFINKRRVAVTRVEQAELPTVNFPDNEEDYKQQHDIHRNDSISVVGHIFDEQKQFYKILLNTNLLSGKIYRIFIDYTGILNDDLLGFYRSSYFNTDTNETRYIAATQFQPPYARQGFPCFDEPALKAKFEISVARRVNMSSISNMDLRITQPILDMDGWVWDHYKKSVPMSTYLVAVVVSDFESKASERSLSKPEFRVWARKSVIQQAEYASEIGPRLLSFFEKYFGVEYPLPKQDMVALPDFTAGGMENWGLIIFRESGMLYDKDSTSEISKFGITSIISHEIGHQWFGNLVTPKWWNDLWLNEGFARYTEFLGTDFIRPDWKAKEKFVTSIQHEALRLDALESSHPISLPVNHPDEISQIFDQISYEKGSSLICMINHVLTEETFRKALKNYFVKWKYTAVVQDNLWEALTEQAHIDGTLDTSLTITEIMNTWTLQKGFPVIEVQRNYDDDSVSFSQRKFSLVDNALLENNYESYKWWVPISFATNTENANFNRTKPSFWLSADKASLTTTEINGSMNSWLVVNVQQTGFYRVNYDLKNWQLIANQLLADYSSIHIVNRAQLLDDAFSLARAGMLDYKKAFNMALYLVEDKDYLPWASFFTATNYVARMLSKTPIYDTYKSFMKNLLGKQHKRVGFYDSVNDSYLLKQHRSILNTMACVMEQKDCVDKAVELFTSWMGQSEPGKSNPIPVNVRSNVYCTAVKHGGLKEWDFLWGIYTKSNGPSEKSTISNALGCSRDKWILNRYIEWASSSGSEIRLQDGPGVLSIVAMEDVGSDVMFKFVREKWLELSKYFGLEIFGLSSVPKFLSVKLNSPLELAEFEEFRTQYRNDLGSAARNVDQSIETVKANVKWMEINYQTISNWLKNQVGSV